MVGRRTADVIVCHLAADIYNAYRVFNRFVCETTLQIQRSLLKYQDGQDRSLTARSELGIKAHDDTSEFIYQNNGPFIET